MLSLEPSQRKHPDPVEELSAILHARHQRRLCGGLEQIQHPQHRAGWDQRHRLQVVGEERVDDAPEAGARGALNEARGNLRGEPLGGVCRAGGVDGLEGRLELSGIRRRSCGRGDVVRLESSSRRGWG